MWYLNSECSVHMTGQLNLFSSLDKLINSRVTMDDESIRKAQGKSTMKINICGLECIKNVLYVLDWDSNLLGLR